MANPAQARLELEQAYSQHKFHYYRNGLPGAGLSYGDIRLAAIAANATANDRARFADIINRRTHSLPRQQGVYNFTQAASATLRTRAFLYRDPFQNWGGAPPPPDRPAAATQANVKDNLNNFRDLLRSSFLFIKCLGWGGEGIVTLWRYRPSPALERLVVMKASVLGARDPRRAARNLRGERDMTTTLCRAPHVVQRFFMAENPITPAVPGARRSARIRAMGHRVDDNDGNYLLLEHCRFGNLLDMLLRAAVDMPPNGTERWLPESVLWRIFDCLIKGCIAMECPPRYVPGNAPPAAPGAAAAALPLATSGGFLPEVVAPGIGPNAGHHGIVHGDLDPRNIFIGDYDAPGLGLMPGHTALPRIQIGDLGAARTEDELWAPIAPPGSSGIAQTVNRINRWLRRHGGKLAYMLPEQFSKDWDRIPRGQDPSEDAPTAWMPAWMQPWARPPPITTGPGRYTSASNVWHIGMIMKVCMTLSPPDQPPWAGRMTSQEPPAPVPVHQERWTYGWSLLNPAEQWLAKYQGPLLDLVAQCLMAKQEYRPTLQQVQAIITQQLALPVNAAVPAYWTNTFFGQPPIPQPPEDTEFVNRLDPFWDYENHDWIGDPPRG